MSEQQQTPTTWTPEWLKAASPAVVLAMDEHRERSEHSKAPPTLAHEVTR